ncbi:hypothetical protein POTOM_016825 [Populus tomentosa]|uniref:Uncharacterized protein n=1 Tax=Populus tomentosa TaxID=118781 RepID=A0A8X7ZZ79_POPTO|nr:hypothetical protein POTOM_016825 [Populus tomentosa]
MPGPKTFPRKPSTEEEWSFPYESESDTEGSCLVSTYADADAENEAHETLRELTQLMRELTVDVEEMKAAIKKISDNVAEFLRRQEDSSS